MRQRGFTLIELLIAIALMAVMSALGWRGIDVLLRSREHTQAQVDRIAIVQTALAQWTADLDALQPVAGVSDSGVHWNGQVLRLLRRSAQPDASGGDGGLTVVGWTARDGQWRRWQSPASTRRGDLQRAWQQAEHWAQDPSANASAWQTALLPLSDWQLIYFRGNAWTHPLSSGDAPAGANPNDNSLPDAIRLQLDLPEASGLPGRLTHDWVRPNFSNNKS